MHVEGKIGVEEAVKELLETEVEEDEGDSFKGMNNAQIAEIYHKMKPGNLRAFTSSISMYTDMMLPAITSLEASLGRFSQDCQQRTQKL